MACEKIAVGTATLTSIFGEAGINQVVPIAAGTKPASVAVVTGGEATVVKDTRVTE